MRGEDVLKKAPGVELLVAFQHLWSETTRRAFTVAAGVLIGEKVMPLATSPTAPTLLRRLVRQSGAESKPTLRSMQIKSGISVMQALPLAALHNSTAIDHAVISTGNSVPNLPTRRKTRAICPFQHPTLHAYDTVQKSGDRPMKAIRVHQFGDPDVL
jgi:hypothetical protein